MYLTLKPDVPVWGLDVEADGLNPTKIWCVCVKNLTTDEERTFTEYEEIRDFIREAVEAGGLFIGHNIIGYDAPNLNRLVGTRIPYSRLVDTFVLSSLYSPSLSGGHSLEAWGERLRMPKGEHNEWDRLSDDMIKYCQQDVRVTVQLWKKLTERMRQVGFSEKSAEIEHKAWCLVKKQQKNGFKFDVPRASQLLAELRAEEKRLQDVIYQLWPPRLAVVGKFAKSRKANGSFTANFEKHRSQFPLVEEMEGGGYVAYDYVEFNLGSPKQRIEKLLELGWEPTQLTPKGNPKVDEESLTKFALESGKEEVSALAKWVVVNSRANMISNWLDLADDEGLIHGNLWLANTLRYRHDKPNTANIPAVRVDKQKEPLRGNAGLFTYEARDLWVTRDPVNRSLVGVDAKGIQLRVLANYLNNKEFTDAVLSGDPHSYNQELGGFRDRPTAKTFIYAYLLGAGDAKVAQIIKGTVKEGREVKQRFESNFRGLKQLVGRLKSELERTGRITLCDGSRVLVPSDHMVLAYLLQGDESRIMKQAGVLIDETCRRQKLDCLQAGFIHDEFQFDVLNEHVDQIMNEVCPQSFQRAGGIFAYKLPIECDAKKGLTWSQTH